MCGIAGVHAPGRRGPEISEVLARMVGTMVHRGPDSEGSFVDDGIGLGMRRLSIIDLATGEQPIPNETRDVWVIQNGEIYNYRELRRDLEKRGHSFSTQSDTEVLVHGWEEWKEGLLPRLNGMFALAVWDVRARQLFLARDRMGIKPLYWARVGDILVFGSELKSLAASGIVDRKLDEVAFGQYLVFEYVPSPRSIWRDVSKLQPASHLSVTADHRPKLASYWDLEFDPDRSGTVEDRKQLVADAVTRAAGLELVSDVPIGVLLSGGVDSTAVALGASRSSGQTISTFSVGFEDDSFDESRYAREVAHHLGTDHHEILLGTAEVSDLMPEVGTIIDEPLADSSVLPTYLLSRFTRQHVKVALGGDGGDELWAGYPTLIAHRAARFYRKLPRWIRSGVASSAELLPTSFNNISFDFKVKRFVTGADLQPELQHHLWIGGYTPDAVRWLVNPDLAALYTDEVLFEPVLSKLPIVKTMEPWDRFLYLDARMYLEGDILTKVDRASMACSLEVRVPLLNSEVIEVARRVPFEWKLNGRRSKAILRDAIAPHVPAHVTTRAKKGFNIPLSKWLAGPQRGLLDYAKGLGDSMVRGESVHRLIDEHLSRKKDQRKLLWPLVVFGLWEGTWMQPEFTVPPPRL